MSDVAKEPSRTYIQIDYRKCTGCRICEMICSVAHGSTAPSHARIHVDSFFPGIDVPSLCKHCIDPPCFECSFDAMAMRKGILLIDDDRCVGCGVCAQNCPIGAITLVESKAVKCDLCGKCVDLCPTQALSFCETADEADLTVPDRASITREILGQEVL